MLETNEGRMLCREDDKSNVKYIFVEIFYFLLLSEFLPLFLHSIKDRVGCKAVELSDYWNFHESYDIRGCYFSSSMKLLIVAK